MGIFNYIGLIIITIIMVPNIIFMATDKNNFENLYKNKLVEVLEQIGRFGCFIFMIINIPYLYTGFWFSDAKPLYIIINGVLVASYLAIWIICHKKSSIFRSLALSIIPSIIFIFSGIMLVNVPLICTALIFAPTHILISFKNSVLTK